MELIKDRLTHILRSKNLTATQFAEMMHIQPSNVSHLLSGRNKPSLDFLIKLKDVFPEYSFDWIILGKKPITVSNANSVRSDNLFEFEDNREKLNSSNDKENTELFDNTIDRFDSDNKEIMSVERKLSNNIKQIICIYEDHTFDIYNLRQ